MSIINNSHQFIFVHVPKTAGTSVTGVLGTFTKYCDQEIGGSVFGEAIQTPYKQRFGLSKHSTAAEIKKIVGPETWASYYTFSFVRNPYTRCLSTYNFLRGWQGGSKEFVAKMKSYASFEDYVLSDLWDHTDGPDQMFKPQVHWLCDPLDNTPLTSFIGRVETLADDLESILLTIAPQERAVLELAVPHLNKSHAESTEFPYANPLVSNKIQQKYAADFQTFGYSPAVDEIVG